MFRKIITIILSMVIITASLPCVSLAYGVTDEIDDGEYNVSFDIEQFYPYDGTTVDFFTRFFRPNMAKLTVKTIDNEKKYTLSVPMEFLNANHFINITKAFGYSRTAYGEDIAYSELVNQEGYINLKNNSEGNALTADDLYKLVHFGSESTSNRVGYIYDIDLNNLSDELYFYYALSKSEQRVKLKISEIIEGGYSPEYTSPLITTNDLSTGSAGNPVTIDGVVTYPATSVLGIIPTAYFDSNPSKYIYEITIDGEKTITERTTSYTAIDIIGRVGYEQLNNTNKASILGIIENKEAHLVNVKFRIGVQYSDVEDTEKIYWSNELETSFNIGKAGLKSIETEDEPDIFTYTEKKLGLTTAPIACIPYDAKLSVNAFDGEDEAIEAKLKEVTGRSAVDFEAVNINITDENGNVNTEYIPTNGHGTAWSDLSEDDILITIPSVKDYDITSMAMYRYDNGNLTKLNRCISIVQNAETGKGICYYNLDSAGPFGTFVFAPEEYSDFDSYSSMTGWYNNAAYLVESGDRFVKSEYDSAVKNNRAYSYNDGSVQYQYISLQPVNNSYITDIMYNNGSEYTAADIIETYSNGAPNVIRIPLIDNKAYTALKFNVNGEEKEAEFAINFASSNKILTKPQLSSPEISVTDSDNEERTKYTNDARAAVSLNKYTDFGTVYYSINGGDETEYTEPFIIETDNEDGETFEISAYIKASGTADSDYGDSETISKTITFSAKGAYAETVAAPVIGTQYKSGEGLSDSVFKVVIISETDDAAIYYTTDGTDPTAESNRYTEPFEVNGETNGAATVIKAVGLKDGMNESETVQKTIVFSTDWWDNILPDTEYIIPVKMVKYGKETSLSMGNDAIAGDAVLKTDLSGNKTMTIPFKQIPVGGILGNIIHFWYFPDIEEFRSDSWAEYMLDYECDYTYTEAGLINSVTFPVYNNADLIPVALESNFDFMGKQQTYIKPDYSEVIYDVIGKTIESNDVDTPEITTVLAADGLSAEVTIGMSSASKDVDADIYYMVTNGEDENWSEETKIKYDGKAFTVTRKDADSSGTVNILAQAVTEDGRASYINLKKIAFDMNAPAVDITKDGKYTVAVDLWKEISDEASMGNAAFENAKRAVITTNNGVSTITVYTTPVTIHDEESGVDVYSALEKMRFENASGQMQYVKGINTLPITAVNGDSTYDFEYLESFSFTLPNTENEYVPVQILVPNTPMGEDYIDARLKLDWSSLAELDESLSISSAAVDDRDIKAVIGNSDNVHITNSGESVLNADVLIAQYEDGTLLDVITKTVTLDAGLSEIVFENVKNDRVDSYKVFVWDSLDGMKPLADALEQAYTE